MLALLLTVASLSSPSIVGTEDRRWHRAISRGTATANRYWPKRQRCRGQERVYVVDSLWENVVGVASPETCTVWLLRSEIDMPAWACADVVHEIGHLRGRAHSRRWGSIMEPIIGRIPPACLVD